MVGPLLPYLLFKLNLIRERVQKIISVSINRKFGVIFSFIVILIIVLPPKSFSQNNNCSNAINLTINAAAVAGTTAGATLEAGELTDCAAAGTNQSVWYKFTASAATLDVTITAPTAACGYSSAVWDGTTGSCPAFNGCHPISCQSGDDGPLTTDHVLTNLTIGGTYYVQVMYSKGGACGNSLAFNINVSTTIAANPSNPAPISTCGATSGTACIFNYNPTVAQIEAACTQYTNPASADGENEVVKACFNFTAQYSSTISFQNLINSNCGAGNVIWFDWSVYDNSCNSIACGNLNNLNASGLICGDSYKMCYAYEIPNCTENFFYPFIVAIPPTFTVTPNGTSSNGTGAICVGNSITLSANATGYTSYQWSPSTGLSSTTGSSVTATPTVSTTYTVVGFDVGGCTQSGTIAITVNPKPTITINPVSICKGTGGSVTAMGAKTYTWSPSTGLTLTTGATVTANPAASTTYTVTGTSAAGCTNNATVVVTVNPVYTVNQNAGICQGASYNLPWGGTENTAGTYSHNYTTAGGCDSTVNITLTVKPIYTVNLNASICQGASYNLLWGGAENVAGTYSHNYTTAGGCDSTVNITLTVNPVYTVNKNASICQGASYNLPWGGAENTAGIYSHTYTSVKGCDSIVNIMLTVNPVYTVNKNAGICQGASYNLPWGGTENIAGTYSHNYITAGGCDSTVNITLTVKPIYTVNQNASICQGSFYNLPWGGTENATGTYSHAYTSASGCDSVVNITLTVNPVYTVNQNASICQGTSYNLPWGGTEGTTGTYPHTYTSASGCDSIVNIALTVNSTLTTNLNQQICQGTSYNLPWGGTESTTGTYSHTYTSGSGCDSTVNIDLAVNPVLTTNLNQQICQGTSYNLPWGGAESATGTYSHTYISANGCDSVVNITLTVNPVYTVNHNAGICQGASYNLPWGGTESTAGTYSHAYTAAGGCDSTVNIILTVNPIYTVNLNASICQGASYNLPWGGAENASGTYSHNYTTAGGCDSTVNITLMVNPVYTVNQNASICQGASYNLPWGGAESTAGTYSHNYTTAGGCDSTVNITLTINPVYTANLNASICQGTSYNLPWGGTENTAGTYSHNYTTAGGCDSTVNITLTVNPVYTVNQNASICQGASYNLPWGGTENTAGTYSHNYTTAGGCDSTVNITLTVNPVYTVNQNASICQGSSYNLPWGGTENTAGTYSHNYITAGGCDSTVNITLNVNPVYTVNQNASICQGASYNLPWGGTENTAGTYSHNYTTAGGCDSTVNITLTVKPIYTVNQNASVCQGASYNLPWGGAENIAGTYSHNYTTASGCDSTVNITLNVNPVYTVNQNASVCQGSSYNLPWGGAENIAGTYSHTYTTAGGCDSTVNITLTVNSVYTVNQNASICQGASYNLPWGGAENATGTFSHTYTSVSGCDSTVNIILAVNPIYTVNLNASVCQGSSYNLPWGGAENTAGTYSHTYTTAGGCDSTVNITLTVNPVYTVNQNASICQGASYNLPWGGTENIAGTYSHNYTTAAGCDSTVNITLNVNPVYTVNQNASICQGASYNLPWGGAENTAGTYSHNYTSVSGCDSTVNITLNVNPVYTVNQNASICQGASYNLPWGGAENTAGTYSHTYTTASGCDSVVNITLTVNPVYTVNQNASICQGTSYNLPWGGAGNTAGTYSHTYTTAGGCDSTVNITLTLNPVYTINQNASICQGASYNLPWGGTENASGTYSHNYTTAGGCDSTVNITLTVNAVYTVNQNASICQGTSYNLPWGGAENTAGTYSHTYTSASGCDSTVNITLSVNPVYTVNQNVSICQGASYNLPWGGAENIAGTYSHNYTTAGGCDSTVNITLTVNPVYTVNQNASICQGASYNLPWGGAENTAGTYSHNYTSVSGCDSTVNITLTVNPVYTVNQNANICQGSSYNLPWGGAENIAGTYSHTYTTAGGCDSTVNITLTVNPVYTINQNASICQGASYNLPWGGTENASGTYSHNYTTAGGCDSTVNITLTVNAVYTVNQNASICQGTSYNLPWGGAENTAGTYSHNYTSTSGCDSIVNIALTVNPLLTTNLNQQICQGSSYSLPWGGTENIAGTYSHTYISAGGCDSTVNIALSVNLVYTVNQNASICQGASYNLPWGGTENTAGTYSHNYTTAGGCDSTVNITLTVNPVYAVNQNASICQGSSYNLPWGGAENIAGTYSHNYTTAGGCDSTVNITLTVNPVYTVNQNASICQGASYNLPWGGAENTAGTYSHNYTSASGCDSTVNITLTVNPVYTVNQNASICQGSSYNLPWGGAENTAGTYSHNYTSASGCDSTVNITLTVNPVYTVNQNASICQGSSYNLPWGGAENTAGTYSHTYTSAGGCDSTVNITLNVNSVYTVNQNASICQGASYNLPWGGAENTAGTYSHTYTSAGGCDSTVNITLNVNSVYTVNQNASICQGASYNLPWGGAENTAGTYSHNYTSVSGCDSTVNITLTVNSVYTVNQNASICQGASYNLPWGGTENASGTYSHTYTSVSGCDSIVNIALTVNSTLTTSLNEQICQGSSYNLPWGGTEDTSGAYSHTYTSASGCDSIVNIALSVNSVLATNLNQQICQGSSYNLPWGGTEDTAGTYSHTYTSASGCDSIVNIALTVNSVLATNLNQQICQGSSYNLSWGGTENTAGTYSHTYASASGCDSTVNITLTVNPVYTVNQNASICQGASYNLPWGGTENTAGTYSHTYTSASGCDSTVNIGLTVNSTLTTNLNQQICQGSSYNLPWGGTENTAGTYSHTYTSASGCDSTVNIGLTVNSTLTTNLNQQICQGSSYNLPWGGTENTAGTYSHTYTSASGCDSTVNITLRVNPVYTVNQTASICQGATYNLPWGGTENTAGTYSHNYTSVSGCDSTVNITLTVNPVYTVNQNANICQGSSYNLPWGGAENIAGTYSHTYTTAGGCDSTVNIILTVNPIYTVNLNASICQGASYNLPWGGTENTAGTYSHTYTSASGCDSTVNITLTVNPVYTVNQNASICQGASYNLPWGGTENTVGTYSHTYTSTSGCDSTVNITLTVNPVYTVNQNASICQGASYNLPWGGAENTAGIYSHNYTTAGGCDSTVNITLMVNPVYTVNQNASICQGSSYNLPWGGAENTAGTYSHSYTTAGGCDSTVNIILTVNPIYTVNLNASICQGASYNLPWGGTENTAGTYSHTYTSASGCDSTVNISLTVNSTLTTNLNQQICQGSSYNLPWGGAENTAGTYSHTYTSASGCDSTVNIGLTVNSTLTTNLNQQICQGSSYNLPWGGTENTAGTYSHTYTSASGCDSTVNIALTVNSTLTTNLNQQICQGSSYNLPWGGTEDTTGTYSHTYTSVSGCDSTVNIMLTVNSTLTTNLNRQICQGASYNLPWGGTEDTTGIYSHTYTSASGCDSTVNIGLMVNSTLTTNLNQQICQGSSYNLPWGGTEDTTGIYSHTYTSASGCDSTVNIGLTVNSTLTTNLNQQICQGSSYNLPWGGTENTAGTYSHTYTSVSGCDSTVNIELTVNSVLTTNLNEQICQGASYNLPWGGTEDTTGIYSHTYTSVSGCDSTVNIMLTVNSTLTTNLNRQICQGSSYNLPWGGTEDTTGTYSHTYTSVSGCDSTVNIMLTVNSTLTTNLNRQICQGSSYSLPWGGTEDTSGTYSHTYTSASGCDSIVNIELTVNSVLTTNLNEQICQGASYNLPWGGTEDTTGTYFHTYTSVSGCDSTVNIMLTVNSTLTTNLNQQICQGSSYNLPWGGAEDTTGIYSHTYTSASGCDSIVNIALTVNSTLTTNLNQQICQGASYNLPWGGTENTAGTFSHTYTAVSGCDSIVNIALTLNSTFTTNLNRQICQGASYNLPWGGTEDTTGTFSHTYTSASGCDSIVNIALTVNSTLTTNLNQQICQGSSYNLPWGGTENTIGTYSHTYISVSGCDSIVNIALTVNSTLTTNLNQQICQGSSYNLPWGGTESTTGTYSHTYTSVSGCDSIVNIALSVNSVLTTNLNQQICQGASYNLPWGGTADTSGAYSHAYTSASGCDSTVNIALTVNSTLITNLNQQICQGSSYNLPWGGTEDTTGTYSHTYTSVSGCDSIVNIALTVNSTLITNLNQQICQGSSYNLPWGGTEDTTGTYSHTYTSVSGCDSIVNIALSVNSVLTTNLNQQICQGASYNLPWGGTEDTTGTYSHAYTSASGCDSTVNIALTVNSVLTTNLNQQICQGSSYNLPWGGTEDTTGTYSHTYTSASGCDSIVNIALTVNPMLTTNLNQQICQGSSYNLPWGGTEDTTGTYSHTYTSASGCDSIVNIALTVNPMLTTNLNQQICQGASYNLPWGGTGDTTGTYSHTYTSASGCDSIVNIALTVNSTLTTNLNQQIRQGSSYNLPWGGTEDTTGTYSHTYTSTSGCDSIVNIALTVNSTLTTNLNQQICQGSSYNLPWGGTENATGTYSHTYTSASGCDSTVNIALTVSSTLTTNLNQQICQGSFYNLPWGGTADTAGTFSHTYTSASGCDSVVNIVITIYNSSVLTDTYIYPTCGSSNGSIDLTASGGMSPYTYYWNTSDTIPNLTGIGVGNYNVTVTDANGCSQTTGIIITCIQPPPCLLTLSANSNDVSCKGKCDGTAAAIPVNGTSPYSFNWSNGATTQNVSGLCSGVYSVIVSNINGCADSAIVTINEPAVLQLTMGATNVICNGLANGAINLAVTGGTLPYSYNWSNGDTAEDLSNLSQGGFNVTVTDQNNCKVVDSVLINQPNSIVIDSVTTPSTCGNSNGGVDISVTGGVNPYTYQWSNSATTEDITNVPGGIYSFKVTDKNGCLDSIEVNIAGSSSVQINVTPGSASFCAGDSVKLTVSGADVYSWTPDIGLSNTTGLNITAAPASTTTYTVTGTNQQTGCFNSVTAIVVVNPTPLINIVSSVGNICPGQNTSLTASGANTYSWSPQVGLSATTGAVVSAAPAVTTSYTVVGINSYGCIDSSTTGITVGQFANIDLTINPDSGCAPLVVNFVDSSLNALSYLWKFGDNSTSSDTNPVHTYVNAGNYQATLIITSTTGCVDSSSGFVKVFAVPQADFSVNPDINQATDLSDATFQFTNLSTNATIYTWQFGDGVIDSATNPVHKYNSVGEYHVSLIASNARGCLDTFELGPVIVVPNGDVFIPNTFTPNGDGLNDEFKVYGKGINDYTMMIFDRWGQKVFSSDEAFPSWDGTLHGKPMNVGVFVYLVEIHFMDGTVVWKHGDVTLIR